MNHRHLPIKHVRQDDQELTLNSSFRLSSLTNTSQGDHLEVFMIEFVVQSNMMISQWLILRLHFSQHNGMED